PFAQFQAGNGYSAGSVWLLTKDDLAEFRITNEQVEVRHMIVGGEIGDLIANDECFSCAGRARGLRYIASGPVQEEPSVPPASALLSHYTATAAEHLALPDAVAYAAAHGGVLQSAQEAVAFRLAAKGADQADELQSTRTAAMYFKDGNTFFIAFDDDPV